MGIIVVNSKGTIEIINPFALKLLGYTAEELLGKKIEACIPKRYHHRHIEDRKGYVKNPRDRPMGLGIDLFAIKKDGDEFPVEVSLSSYLNNGEENIIAFISDISVRKKAETEIKKLNDELEATVEKRTMDLKEAMHELEMNREKLEDVLAYQKALLDNAGAIIIATDEKGITKLYNPEAEKILGYHESEIINKTTPVIFHDKTEIEKKRKELRNNLGIEVKNDFEVLVEKSRRDTHEEEQYTFIRKDGTSFPASLTFTALRDHSGEITGFIGIAIDVSTRRKAEENLEKALEKEKELSELKSRFVSMASHEFRTPLSTVLSSAYLINKYVAAEDQSKREKHLDRIISSVNMLTDILNDFLSLGKIEEGKIQVRPSAFNIKEVITTIISDIKNTLKKQQEISYHHEGDTGVVLDASLLKHIVMNLVSNAGKFSPEKSNIKIKTIQYDHKIMLSVKDDGIGISREDQAHLMERFFRGANAGNIQGTGLGLHIVSKYAELMNGTVVCKSELEKGTEFIITFNTQKG